MIINMMKKNLNITAIIFFAFFLSCTNNETDSENSLITIKKDEMLKYSQENRKLDFSDMDFSAISFEFSEQDAIVITHKDKKNRKSLFLDAINNLLLETEKDESSEKEYLGLNFSVSLTKNAYSIYPKKFVFTNNENANRVASCPNGMNKHKTCHSSSCVRETLAIYGEVMSSGDSFSVHYGTFGVKICANAGLIQKANAYIAPPD